MELHKAPTKPMQGSDPSSRATAFTFGKAIVQERASRDQAQTNRYNGNRLINLAMHWKWLCRHAHTREES